MVGYNLFCKRTTNGKDLIIPSVWSRKEIEPKPFALSSNFSSDPIEYGYAYVKFFGSPPLDKNLAFGDLS